ncbi:unnamed protein product [Soboliphyme baturini]|uniref:Pept_C1 domain-containing protein n=1 Tax=Soboliphyme baturini TaxID=241478 RepID=A0A183J7S5_9BILA|nr:unnamed protein product [Soboliphyme baturini]
MVKIVFLCLLPFVLGGYHEDNYEDIKKEMEGMELTWEHGIHENFRKLSKEQLRNMLGSKPNEEEYKAAEAEAIELEDEDDIPKEFDARQHWPFCSSIRLIRNQANCGSCWAVSTASVMSDRVCIATGGYKQPYISDENILSCCKFCGGG